MIVVDSNKCPQDHNCPMVNKCPKHAITQNGNAAPSVNNDMCISCGICVKTCPYSCFVVK